MNRSGKAESQRKYKSKNPWMINLSCAKNRCSKSNNLSYSRYGGRGIKFKLSNEEGRVLWFRDNANAIKKPSLDRINSDGDYTFNNCRFMELSANIRRGALANIAKQRDKCKVLLETGLPEIGPLVGPRFSDYQVATMRRITKGQWGMAKAIATFYGVSETCINKILEMKRRVIAAQEPKP